MCVGLPCDVCLCHVCGTADRRVMSETHKGAAGTNEEEDDDENFKMVLCSNDLVTSMVGGIPAHSCCEATMMTEAVAARTFTMTQSHQMRGPNHVCRRTPHMIEDTCIPK
eukprot:GFYU01011710.1.p1 GENE.GFYU01011710.1~~GFYU01011710.1.p1  ORF type:complete len:110 (+),score=3.80 GFYU01011710.1:214-543(+)